MDFIDKAMALWERFSEKAEPAIIKIQSYANEWKKAVLTVWDFVRRMKKMVLAVPVAAVSVILALNNLFRLPSLVGFFLQETGEYSFQMLRELAVLAPMALTAICLLLMFLSKRTLTPWLVSVFTLAVPIAILLTNTFPA